ncbi:MAG TPA: hypothetical protein DDY70_04220, partial [Clostridiales bacterium]|nr:hypothetical protein [Clostridiales bacterium]
MKILIVFKTHLDLGYTDLAARVEAHYMDEMIPHALDLAEKTNGKFVWTTGAWLIDRFLHSSDANRIRMENAIRKGYIAWHGLPMTMHAEMMDADLYAYGLTISQRLDSRFGKHTTAAKATDVPGMTRAVVPFLAKAGISLLHVGVNPFSAVPDVPNIFRWAAPTGESVTVIYDKTYGEMIRLPGTDTLLYFAMTNDNMGPQTPEEVDALYLALEKQYPGAEIHAGTLNEAAALLEKAAPELPVVTSEIGDTWAHGYQSDPGKQSGFRALLRYLKTLPEEERLRAYPSLLLVGEHTCGVSNARYLHDDGHYLRSEFDACRALPNYRFCESSWQEQRAYLTAAIDALSPVYREGARRAVEEYKTEMPSGDGEEIPVACPMYIGSEIRLGAFTFRIGGDGAIYGLKKDGETLAPDTVRLFSLRYTVYDAADTLRYCEQYGKDRLPWGYDDFAKKGLEKAGICHMACGSVADRVLREGDTFRIFSHCDPMFSERFGCPKRFTLTLTAKEDSLYADFAWFEKPASRIPEGITLTVEHPLTEGADSVRKLGEWIDPRDVVSHGGRALHGTDFGVRIG